VGQDSRSVVTLLAAFDAFYFEPRRCGDLGGGVEGDRVWLACSCGAVINRPADRD